MMKKLYVCPLNEGQVNIIINSDQCDAILNSIMTVRKSRCQS